MQEQLDLIPAIGTPNTPAVTVAEQMQKIFRSLATLQSGDTRPAGIKDGEFWCRDIDGNKKNFKWYRYVEEQVEDEIVGKDIEVIPMFFVQSISDSKTAREDAAPSEKAVALKLENYVTTDTKQEITDTKLFKTKPAESYPVAFQYPDYVKGQSFEGIRVAREIVVRDKNGTHLSTFISRGYPNGRYTCGIMVSGRDGTEKQEYQNVNVGFDPVKDKFFTYAPTPPADDNSTQIATTAWVNSNGLKLLETRSTLGAVTLTGIIPNKPIFAIMSNIQAGDCALLIQFKTGFLTQNNRAVIIGCLTEQFSTNVAVGVPSTGTAVIEIGQPVGEGLVSGWRMDFFQ